MNLYQRQIFGNKKTSSDGVVYIPTLIDWKSVTGSLDLSRDGEVHLNVYGAATTAIWDKEFNYLIDWRVTWIFEKTPLGFGTFDQYWNAVFGLVKVSNTNNYVFDFGTRNTTDWRYFFAGDTAQGSMGSWVDPLVSYRIDYVSGIFYLYRNNILRRTFSPSLTENLKMRVNMRYHDVKDLKYIELIS